MDADVALTTTRAVRRRLDASRPVPREIIDECVGIASQAPSGGNRQALRWVMVEDAEVRLSVVETFRDYALDRFRTLHARASDRSARLAYKGALELVERLHTIPILAIPSMIGAPPEPMTNAQAAGFYGSAVPAIWSFQIALRARGLGSTYTTVHLEHERQVAELLGLPAGVRQIALLPVAYTVGDGFKPAARLPTDRTVSYDGWSDALSAIGNGATSR